MDIMRKKMKLFMICSLLFFAVLTADQESAAYASGGEAVEIKSDHVNNEIIVEFDKSVSVKKMKKIVARQDGEGIQLIDTFNEGLTGVVKLPKDQTVEEAAAVYGKESGVVHVQPNYIYKLPDEKSDAKAELNGVSRQSVNDTVLWHLQNISVAGAWQQAAGVRHTKTRVAVVDTGVDVTHPDLQANLNVGLCADVSTGVIRPMPGDSDGHGTHVSGIIAATANNGQGVAGVASGMDNSCVDLFVVKASIGSRFSTDTILAGIKYAYDNGAKVINLSLGGLYDYRLQEAKMIDQVVSNGTVVVCAAGNEGKRDPCYPSDYTSTISVTSVNSGNERSEFSNFGFSKTIAAPGEKIQSTYPNAKYTLLSGTSMATPVVTGVAALMYSVNPKLSTDAVRQILCNTAKDIGEKGFDIYTGHGLVNAEEAVKQAISAIDQTDIETPYKPEQFTAKIVSYTNSSVTIAVSTPTEYVKYWGYAFDTHINAMREYFGNNCNRNINRYTLQFCNLKPNTEYYFRLYYVTERYRVDTQTWPFMLKSANTRSKGGGSYAELIELKRAASIGGE